MIASFVRKTHDKGTSVKRFIPKIENEVTTCTESDGPQKTVDRLKDVTLDAWPWSCLQLRYNNETLGKFISKSCPDIYDAASKGYIGFVQYYATKYGVDKLYLSQDEDIRTPVQLAIANGHLNVVKYAIAKSELTSFLFLNMFQEAVHHSQFAIVDFFIHEKTFVPNLHDDEEALVTLAAVRAGNMHMLRYLIEQNGFPADVRDKDLLYKAAESGKLSTLKYLIEERAFVVEAYDYDLLYSATLGGNIDLLKYLIHAKNVKKDGTSYRGTVVHAAVRSGKFETVRFVVETLNHDVNASIISDGTTPAHLAAAVSRPILEYLIEEKHADLAARLSNGDNLLHVAAAAGQIENVRYLVERKNMSVDRANSEHLTPLQKAVRKGRLNVVKYLAGERKAYIDRTGVDGQNLLHQAVLGGSVEVMRYLIGDMKMHSRIEDRDSENRTVAMIAAQMNSIKILKYLIDEKNASTSFMDKGGDRLLWISSDEKLTSHRLATLKYLIEEKVLDFNALASTNPMRYVYLKYFHCRYIDVCQRWDKCPGEEICRRWGEYLKKMMVYLDTLEN